MFFACGLHVFTRLLHGFYLRFARLLLVYYAFKRAFGSLGRPEHLPDDRHRAAHHGALGGGSLRGRGGQRGVHGEGGLPGAQRAARERHRPKEDGMINGDLGMYVIDRMYNIYR